MLNGKCLQDKAVEIPGLIDEGIRNVVVVSDLHAGSKLGLCTPDGAQMDEDTLYLPSTAQKKVWAYWEEFWGDWVPEVCHGEPFILVVNGDCLDGDHHNTTSTITNNLTYQRRLAEKILKPVVDHRMCAGYYHIRGTEAHSGQSGTDEEQVAASLGAIPNSQGQHARWELWLKMKVNDALIHCTHHIGCSSTAAGEATAVIKELVNAYTEAGRWRAQPPDVCVRSHRHQCSEVRLPTALGYGISFVTPAWQLATPFRWRLGNKASMPQFGGSIIRCGDCDLYTRHFVKSIGRGKIDEI